MKTAVILFFLLAYFQAKTSLVSARAIECEVELEPEELACIDEFHLNKEEIQTINNRDIAPEDNADFNKFLGCYYQKINWQDPSTGEINWENFKRSMEEVLVGKIENQSPTVIMLMKKMLLSTVTECRNNPPRKGNTHGQTVARTQNCVVEKLNGLVEEFINN